MNRPRCVIKIGGSLIPEYLGGIVDAVADGAARWRIVLVPGGGRLVRVLRDYRRQCPGLAPRALYECALLAMRQHALLIRDLRGFEIRDTFARLHHGCDEAVSVFAPHPQQIDVEASREWDLEGASSDTLAAYCAVFTDAMLIKLTDVDGILDGDPRTASRPALLATVSTGDLTAQTCIDVGAPRIIEEHAIQAWILNGHHPDRLRRLLSGQPVVGTRVLPRHRGVR